MEERVICKITDAIKFKREILCMDTAVKGNVLAYHAIATDVDNTFEDNYNGIFTIWGKTTSTVSEGQALLEIMRRIF